VGTNFPEDILRPHPISDSCFFRQIPTAVCLTLVDANKEKKMDEYQYQQLLKDENNFSLQNGDLHFFEINVASVCALTLWPYFVLMHTRMETKFP
jgi:hypothetical protein